MENNAKSEILSMGVQVRHRSQKKLFSRQNYMPFLQRNRRLPENQNSLSPGQYDIDQFMKKTNSQYQNDHKIINPQQQSVYFKSLINRFCSTKNQSPGPASYEIQEGFSTRKLKKLRLSEKIKRKTTSCKTSFRYPSIPSNKIKFGYKKRQNGLYQPINKTCEQVQAEKMVGRKYLKTLINERKYEKIVTNQNEKSNLSNISKYVEDSQRRSFSGDRFREATFHAPLKSNFYNRQKVQQVMNETKKYQEKRGPGSYEIPSQITVKIERKPKLECFNSTQIRFRNKQKQNKQTNKFWHSDQKKHSSKNILKFRKTLQKNNIRMRSTHKNLFQMKQIDLKENINLINQHKEKKTLLHNQIKQLNYAPKKIRKENQISEITVSEWKQIENSLSCPFSKEKLKNI